MKCKYNKAWVGQCGKDALENGQCEKHQEKCTFKSCENLAVGECDYTGFLVCGRPLCADCKCNHK